jgi:hypothetical protein
MSTWLDNYWGNLKAILAAAWPELTAGTVPVVRRDVAVERINWGNYLADGQLTAPWVIVKIEYEPTDQWPANLPAYTVRPTIWYVVEVLNEDSATAMSKIEGKLETLRQAIMNDVTLGTTLSEAPIDTTADNPVTLTFLDQDLPYQAGSIQFQTIVVAVSS